ncbi:hypothetical protein E2P81_ATG01309 [Venturia nashicola]|uniref:Uncharacterized protein n=1 Tax=Venturia nashicola TaxID=86259 RepID=A0A4Z1PBU3_9PEZI|nr:hypothetical protein E6O75_ATG01341 [Venturia nashicola]TLD38766.1 hypothetical protein E2P81_ATG01309 [Venturia nashicola]
MASDANVHGAGQFEPLVTPRTAGNNVFLVSSACNSGAVSAYNSESRRGERHRHVIQRAVEENGGGLSTRKPASRVVTLPGRTEECFNNEAF